MSDTPTPDNPTVPDGADTTPMAHFAVLVDGEFAGALSLPRTAQLESVIAGLSSNPQVILLRNRSEATGLEIGTYWNRDAGTQP
jgi:hypothetical protein